jgi:hypothetical protein
VHAHHQLTLANASRSAFTSFIQPVGGEARGPDGGRMEQVWFDK